MHKVKKYPKDVGKQEQDLPGVIDSNANKEDVLGENKTYFHFER